MLAAIQPGAFYHLETLEGPRYAGLFDRLIRPESLDAASLEGVTRLLVPCRTHPRRMLPARSTLDAFLARGGTLVVLGETRPDLWLEGVAFTPVETNFWWWLAPGADLGVRVFRPEHPLLRGIGDREASWHLHGWFERGADMEVLIADPEGRPIFFEARRGAGRIVVTSLDPTYHHGSHFMPATTRFLDRFLPNLAAWLP